MASESRQVGHQIELEILILAYDSCQVGHQIELEILIVAYESRQVGHQSLQNRRKFYYEIL